MHRVGVTALALSLVTGLGGFAAAAAAPSAGPPRVPGQQQVHAARDRAAHAADDVRGSRRRSPGQPAAPGRLDARRAGRRGLQRRPLAAPAGPPRGPDRRAARPARRAPTPSASSVTRTPPRWSRPTSSARRLSPLSAITDSDGIDDRDRASCRRCRTPSRRMDHTYDSFRAVLDAGRRWPATRPRPRGPQAATLAAAGPARPATRPSRRPRPRTPPPGRSPPQKTALIHRSRGCSTSASRSPSSASAGIEQAAEAAAAPGGRSARRGARPRAQAAAGGPGGAQAQQDQQAQQHRFRLGSDRHPDQRPGAGAATHRPHRQPPRRTPRLRRRALLPPSPSPGPRSASPTSGARPDRTPGTARA